MSNKGETVLDWKKVEMPVQKDEMWIKGMFLGPITYVKKEPHAKKRN